MLTKISARLVLVGLLTLSVASLVYGQATGSISGIVTDTTGSAVPNAKVTVTAPATGISRTATTSQGGEYIVPLLGVANYNIQVELQGFQSAKADDIRLQVDEHRELDFKLSPASVQTSVEVSATAVAIQTADATLGQVITSQQVADLPLNGRDFVQLATLTPGVSQETNPNSFFNGGPSSEASARGSYSLSVGGSRANSTDWLLDGNDNNELTSGAISILSSIDSIQEFKVLTYNYSAEWGTRGGPTVLVTTKSGSNNFHGSLFEFLRNTDLDARSFFAANTEKFNLNQFGASFGGPIKKDKVFFFMDYEEKYQRHGIPFTGLVPTVAMRDGNFTDNAFGQPNTTGALESLHVNNMLPASSIDRVGQELINLYPLPNANNPALEYNYTSEPVRSLNEGKFDIRLDENLSAKDTLFARFSYDQAESYVPGGAPGFAEQGAFASNQSIQNHARNAAISETHLFSPNTVNQMSFGFNRIFDYITSQGTGSCYSQTLGIPGANLGGNSCGLTSVEMSTYWSLGDRGYTPFVGGTNVWTFNDSLDLVRGNHDIRAGFGYRANQLNTVAVGFPNGFWVVVGVTGDAAADLLAGIYVYGAHDQEFDGGVTGRRWKMYRPYVEDTWRVGKNLTLNLGLAYAMVTPISEVANRQSNFDPATAQFLIAGQSAGPNAGIKMDWTALEPRLGAAWKPFGNSTVFRGGYAIFHDSSWNQGAQGLWQNPPYYAEADNYGSSPMAAGIPDIHFATRSLHFHRHPLVAKYRFQAGPNSTIQRECGAADTGEHRPDGRVCRLARISHSGVAGTTSMWDPQGMRHCLRIYLGMRAGRSRFRLSLRLYVSMFGDIEYLRQRTVALQLAADQSRDQECARWYVRAHLYTYSRSYDTGFSDGLGSIIGATYFPLPDFRTWIGDFRKST